MASDGACQFTLEAYRDTPSPARRLVALSSWRAAPLDPLELYTSLLQMCRSDRSGCNTHHTFSVFNAADARLSFAEDFGDLLASPAAAAAAAAAALRALCDGWDDLRPSQGDAQAALRALFATLKHIGVAVRARLTDVTAAQLSGLCATLVQLAREHSIDDLPDAAAAFA